MELIGIHARWMAVSTMAFVPPVSRRERLHAGEQPGREVIVRQMAIRHALGRGPARPRDSAKAGDAPHRLHEGGRARAVARSC